jgi:hypothetical protein
MADLTVLTSETVVQIQEAIYRLAANHSSAGAWHVLDHMTPGMARPDRTVDSFHFFARKCAGTPNAIKVASQLGRRDVSGCCLPADIAPMPISLTSTMRLLHLFCG